MTLKFRSEQYIRKANISKEVRKYDHVHKAFEDG